MADDSAPFLVGAGQVAGHIHQGDERDVEGVAEPDEARRLVAGVDVERPRLMHRLVGYDAHRVAVKPRESGNDVRREQREQLEEVGLITALVEDAGDDLADVVGSPQVRRNDVEERLVRPAGRVPPVYPRRHLAAARRQVAEQFPDVGEAVGLALLGTADDARFLLGDDRPAEFFIRDVLADRRLDDSRSGDEGVADSLDHEDEVHQRR